MTDVPSYKKKDFISDQEVRWCPGCGDYAILSSVQMAMTKIGKKREDIAFISGIGCSSRFPYYMNTYGLHTIHGRAPAVASGLKVQNPSLSVWQITGDGDGLSIGGNHLIHAIRRNVDMNILLFNNEIYGLTKGQYSPTSQAKIVTKSSPYGSIDNSFSPVRLALGAGATFFARTIDSDPKHMIETFLQAEEHRGLAFIEILQNCVIFNDKVHDDQTNRLIRDEHTVRLEDGEPMIYGKARDKGLLLEGFNPRIVDLTNGGEDAVIKHDKSNPNVANMLASLSRESFPVPLGVLYQADAPIYDRQVAEQISEVTEKKGTGNLHDILYDSETWEVK